MLLFNILSLSALALTPSSPEAPQRRKPQVYVRLPESLVAARLIGDEKQFKNDLVEIAQRVSLPGDPTITIVLDPTSSFQAARRHVILEGNVCEITISTQAFALVKNLSELAALIAYEISTLKYEYLRKVEAIKREYSISNGADIEAMLLKRIEATEQDQEKKEWDKRVEIEKIYKLIPIVRQYKIYQGREGEFQDFLRRTGINPHETPKTVERLECSKETVDRISTGGFDPWGAMAPLKKIWISDFERIGPIRKLYRINKQTYKAPEPINSPIEFLRSYLAYVEAKNTDILQQPFRGAPLTKEQAKLRVSGLVSRTLKLGPFETELAAGGVVITGLVGLLYHWSEAMGKAGVAWDKTYGFISSIGSGSGESSASTTDLPARLVEEASSASKEGMGPGFWDKIGHWIYSAGESAVNGTVSAIEGFFGFIKSAAIGLYGLPGFHEALHYSGENWKELIIGTFVKFAVIDNVIKYRREGGQWYGTRYRQNLQNQFLIGSELLKANDLTLTPEQLVELARSYSEANAFLYDGRYPEKERVEARLLYQELVYRDTKLSTNGFNDGVGRPLAKSAQKSLEQKQGRPFTREELEGASVSKKIVKEMRRMAREQWLLKGELPEGHKPANVENGDYSVLSEIEQKTSTQKERFDKYSSLPRVVSAINGALLMTAIERAADRKDLKPEDMEKLKEAIQNLKGTEFFNEKLLKKYQALRSKFIPNEPAFATLEGYRSEQSKDKRTARSQLVALSKQNNLSNKEILAVMTELYLNNLHYDLYRFLMKNMKSVIELSRTIDRTDPSKNHEAFALDAAVKAAIGYINEDSSGYWWTKIYRRARFFFLAYRHGSPVERAGLLSWLEAKEIEFPGIPRFFSKKIVDKKTTRDLDTKEFMEHIETLRKEFNVDPLILARLVDRFLIQHPERISSLETVERILDSDAFWKRYTDVKPKQDWEKGIIDHYKSFRAKYPSFNYDPQFSERFQKVLVNKFEAYKPQATLQERMDFFMRLAGRGTTGLTDEQFEKIWEQMPESTHKIEFGKEVLAKGLVWEPSVRLSLYQVINADTTSAQALQREVGEKLKALDFFIEQQRSEPEKSRERVRSINKFLENAVGKQDLKNEKNFKRLLHKAVRGQALSLEEKEIFEHAIKENLINEHFKRVREVFPESGATWIKLANWVASRLELNQAETYAAKKAHIDKIEATKDLGYSSINAIIQGALTWSKAERWKLIMWLRGSAPAPRTLLAQLTLFGPDTIRRLYSTQPIEARQGFIGMLLGDPHHGLVDGAARSLYSEQILNELLPKSSSTASVANELLHAFLKSVDEISSPEKKITVLSFLLANKTEGKTNVGVVLRNLFMSYGVVGVKFGQLLASSDILEPEIRKELEVLRDKANEPNWHEIYEKLNKILGTKSIDPHLRIKAIKGSASIKISLLVEDLKAITANPELYAKDPTLFEHILSIKRDEAEIGIGRNLMELTKVVEHLVNHVNPRTYSFLKGMGDSTAAAIWRELSFDMESVKSEIGSKTYAGLKERPGLRTIVAPTTDLVERLPGPKSKFHWLRTSQFMKGKSLSQLPLDKAALHAADVLNQEFEIHWSEKPIEMDPDRHPGNEIFDEDPVTKERYRRIIDLGQYLTGPLKLTPEKRRNMIRIMAYSQIFEVVGPLPKLTDRFLNEFNFKGKDRALLKKTISGQFPARGGKERASIAVYFHLLSAMEDAGFSKEIINYDFVKAIYALEPYEKAAKSIKHDSSKQKLTEMVLKEVDSLRAHSTPTVREKIQYALMRPVSAAYAARNIARLKEKEITKESDQKTKPKEKTRKEIAQPKSQSFFSSTGNVYAGELVNAIFWGIYDQNRTRAMHWLHELGTLEKHAGFGAFAIASGLYSEMSNRVIPLSKVTTRFINQSGLSMAVGSVASEVVRRVLNDEPLGAILDHILSEDYLRELTYSTLTFMAAELVLGAGKKAGKAIVPSMFPSCEKWYSGIGHTAMLFITAEAIGRGGRLPAEMLGLVKSQEYTSISRIGKKHIQPILEDFEWIRDQIKAGHCLPALKKMYGETKGIVYYSWDHFEYENPDLPASAGSTYFKLQRYLADIESAKTYTTDPLLTHYIEEELQAVSKMLEDAPPLNRENDFEKCSDFTELSEFYARPNPDRDNR